MGKETKVEWADHTFNCWRGCSKVSEACRNCYAETQAKRNPGVLGVWGDNGTRVVASEATWKEPLKWDREAKSAGVRRRVFCASMADVFEDWQDQLLWSDGTPAVDRFSEEPYTLNHARRDLFQLIDATPNLDWLLLTKRPENIARMMPPAITNLTIHNRMKQAGTWHGEQYRENVWIGTTVENQQSADERIPHLLRVPAKVRFLSCEPLLGPVDLSRYIGGVCDCGKIESGRCHTDCPSQSVQYWRGAKIDWVIAGGESGPHARPSHPDWFRSLRDQCQAAGVPYFFKQWGCWHPTNIGNSGHDLHRFDGDGGVVLACVGKSAAGRLLDGREWNEVPG